jgi:imidazolonepropionase-like amidohydrolase
MTIPAITLINTKAVIDGTGAKLLENVTVVLEGSSIKTVQPRGQISVPAECNPRILDFPDGYLLPGLIDVHTHLMFGGWSKHYEEVIREDSDQISLLRASKNALTHLRSGVTSLRDNGSRNNVTFNLREGALRGYATTPRLFLCGRPITLTGGHFHWCNQEADGVGGVRIAVRQLVKDGADHIKIMAAGGGTTITDNRRPSYTVEELRAIVDETHNMGKLTTAHCLATQSLTNALEAGVDMIEHAGFIEPDGSYKFHPEIGERIAKQGVYFSPTVQTGYRNRQALLTKESERILTKIEYHKLEALKAKCESQLEFLGLMWNKSGVQIVSGTDAIQMFGDYCLGLELMSEAGMSNMDIIKASTSIAAESMGISEMTGSIKPGKEADLIVVEQNPLLDIKALRKMSMVMLGGEQIV